MSYIPPKPRWDRPRLDDGSHSRDRHASKRASPDQHHRTRRESPHRTLATAALPRTCSAPMECSPQFKVRQKERFARILSENGLDVGLLEPIWTEPWPDVKKHLFDPITSAPRFLLKVEVWKPVVKAYFAWYYIPREQCTHMWAEIVDMLLRLPPENSGSSEFKAWAYGCLCRFYLEDLKKIRPSVEPPKSAAPAQYDPSANWKL